MLLTTLAFAFAQGIANVMNNLNYQVVRTPIECCIINIHHSFQRKDCCF